MRRPHRWGASGGSSAPGAGRGRRWPSGSCCGARPRLGRVGRLSRGAGSSRRTSLRGLPFGAWWRLVQASSGINIDESRYFRYGIAARVLMTVDIGAHRMSEQQLPVVVIGAGPVGLAAAAQLLERRLEPLVLERGDEVAS